MPSAALTGLLWAHHDLKSVYADDYTLAEHEPEIPARADLPSSVISDVSVSSAPSVRVAAAPSASMISGPAAGTAPPRSGTLVSSALLFITCCFGCSCIGVPWAYAQCGWALAIVLMLVSAAITHWGANLLLDCAVKVAGDPTGGVSIKEIARAVNPRLMALPEIVVILNCVGSGIGALVVAGYLIPRTFQNLASLQHQLSVAPTPLPIWNDLQKERVLWISIVLACALPFCFLRDISPLKSAGIVSVVAVSLLVAVIVTAYALPAQLHTCELYTQEALTCAVDVVPATASVKGILAAVPVFFFNYSSNYQLLTVHNALAKKSPRTTSLAVGGALSVTSVAYVVMGASSYLTFGKNVEANILGNYGNSLAIDLSRLGIIATCTMLFPVTVFTARVSIMSILGGAFVKRHGPKRVFLAATLAIIAFNWAVAVGISQINLILGVAGALSTVPISLVLPGQYLIALFPGPDGKAQRIKGHVALWAGVVLTIVCLYGTLAVGSG